MANSSAKAIKTRIKSIESTMQITRAMELVSSSRLQKAKKHAENTSAVRTTLIDAIREAAGDYGTGSSVFFTKNNSTKSIYIVISGDRGLAGGFNNNLFRAVAKHAGESEPTVITIGKKAAEHYKSEKKVSAAGISNKKCRELANTLKNMLVSGETGNIFIAYNSFKSAFSQEPVIEKLLPIEEHDKKKELTIYEPSAEKVFDDIISWYLSTYIYCSVCESIAAEHAARRNAMAAANKNGSEMIENMRLEYNRARQSVITQELNEIVAGADAL
ncbi:MAG: ATP synthase F1 subunit gamma [Clostridia bacterium]|nr:ATP synthase F1 subunit gamma [Clostridia bacterium]